MKKKQNKQKFNLVRMLVIIFISLFGMTLASIFLNEWLKRLSKKDQSSNADNAKVFTNRNRYTTYQPRRDSRVSFQHDFFLNKEVMYTDWNEQAHQMSFINTAIPEKDMTLLKEFTAYNLASYITFIDINIKIASRQKDTKKIQWFTNLSEFFKDIYTNYHKLIKLGENINIDIEHEQNNLIITYPNKLLEKLKLEKPKSKGNIDIWIKQRFKNYNLRDIKNEAYSTYYLDLTHKLSEMLHNKLKADFKDMLNLPNAHAFNDETNNDLRPC